MAKSSQEGSIWDNCFDWLVKASPHLSVAQWRTRRQKRVPRVFGVVRVR